MPTLSGVDYNNIMIYMNTVGRAIQCMKFTMHEGVVQVQHRKKKTKRKEREKARKERGRQEKGKERKKTTIQPASKQTNNGAMERWVDRWTDGSINSVNQDMHVHNNSCKYMQM